MKKIYRIVFFYLVSVQLYSQTINLKGVVKDSIGVGLEMANVIAFNSATNTMTEYAITDSKGKYTIGLPANQTYELRVSYIGYNTQTVLIDLKGVQKEFSKNIVLKETQDMLDVVEISYEMPVTVKGDTIVYNSDSFRNGTEKKLGDVLENLPGVEINDDGEIEIEGKTVTKVMVEGKDFFDGDSKIAVENIPANALDKIEVLRNYNEVGQMKGVTNNEDSIAINIRLKKGKDKFWFGEVTAGAGIDERYLIKPKVFYYSPKTSVNLLTDFNNTGQVPFTNRDYYRFTGGYRNISARGGTSLNVGDNSIGLSTTQNNRAKELTSQFGAANFSTNPNDKITISGFGIYSGTKTDLLESSKKTYQDIDEVDVVEKIESANRQESQLGLLKLSTVYKPSTDFQLDYDMFFKKSEQEEGQIRTSKVNELERDTILSDKNDDPFSFTQNLNIYHTINPKNILAFEAQYLYQKEQPLFHSVSDEINVVEFLDPIDLDQDSYNLFQDKMITTGKLDAKIDHFYVINSKSHLNTTLGTLLSTQDFNSGIIQVLDDKSENDFLDPAFVNDVQFRFSDIYAGLHYKFVYKKFTLEPGVKLHLYTTKDSQLGDDNTTSLVRLLPDFYASYQFKKTESLRFNYSMSNQFTDVNNLSQGVLFNNYNSVYSGNRYLESAIYHKYSLNYFSFIMYNYTNINGSLSYTKKENSIINSSQRGVGIGQELTSINSLFPDETISTRFRYGRTFRKLKVNFRTSGNYSRNNNFRGEDWIVNDVYSYSFGGDVGTNFNIAPNIKVGYTKNINDYSEIVYYTDKPFVNVDAAFLKHFIFTADYSYFNYTDQAKTISNKYSFLKAELSFRKTESPWEYSVSGTNLLDAKSLNRDSNSLATNTVTSSSYYVQPRFIMFTLKYNL